MNIFYSDIDECAVGGTADCDATNGACTNTVGSFTCACNPGYSGDGKTCEGAHISNWYLYIAYLRLVFKVLDMRLKQIL